MDPALPEWLNKKFLTSCLQGGEEEEPRVKILEFTAESAVPPGTNYASHLYRVRVKFLRESTEESEALIVKAPLTAGIVVEAGDSFDVSTTEKLAYEKLLPFIKEKVNIEYGPQPYYCEIEKGFVLKDLTAGGYVMCDRFKQLDYEHCKSVLENLAKFHAASIVCHKEKPELIEKIGEEKIFKEGGSFQQVLLPWLQGAVVAVGNIVKNMEGCEAAADLISSRTERLPQSIIELCKKRENFNVLNHGDLWCNNIMFKHNESGKVADVKMIDFQVMRWTSPVMDLIYFTWTSANEDVRENRLEELYNDIYLKTLNLTLKELGCEERLSQEQLWADLKGATDWILLVVCSTLPMLICEVKDVMNTEEMSLDDFNTDKTNLKWGAMFNGKYYKALLPGVMRQIQKWESS